MTHFFDIEVAKEIGVEKAVLLQNIYYWIFRNKANDKNYHDGYYWTYNSARAMSELFPYMSQQKIKNNLRWLVDNGYLLDGNYNERQYDRTKWYTLTEKGLNLYEKSEQSIVQNCTMESTESYNGLDKTVQPIPNINTNKNTDNDINNNSVAKNVIEYLNEKTNKKYKWKTQHTLKLINARINEGYTLSDFKIVIDKKCKDWLGTDMEQYLRPSTLFAPSKFDGYLNQPVSKGVTARTKWNEPKPEPIRYKKFESTEVDKKERADQETAAEAIKKMRAKLKQGCDSVGDGIKIIADEFKNI